MKIPLPTIEPAAINVASSSPNERLKSDINIF
jgi:hypothetical protein